jgi:hypothetical protein
MVLPPRLPGTRPRASARTLAFLTLRRYGATTVFRIGSITQVLRSGSLVFAGRSTACPAGSLAVPGADWGEAEGRGCALPGRAPSSSPVRGANWREARGLVTCTVHWRIRARSGRMTITVDSHRPAAADEAMRHLPAPVDLDQVGGGRDSTALPETFSSARWAVAHDVVRLGRPIKLPLPRGWAAGRNEVPQLIAEVPKSDPSGLAPSQGRRRADDGCAG